MSLKEYKRKRNFAKTAEPRGEHARSGATRRFVIQKHAASRLHYDFRLEVDGTLKSWAVPKGVPFAKGEKRLAVEVEDHPVSYIDFEGTIPKGQYGGGTVMVWDRGTYQTAAKNPAADLQAGKLHFTLKGEKLQGEWYLVRLRDDTQWLLIKGGADVAPISRKLDDTSARSGKSMEELGRSGAVWPSKPVSPKKKHSEPKAKTVTTPIASSRRTGAPPLPFPLPRSERGRGCPKGGRGGSSEVQSAKSNLGGFSPRFITPMLARPVSALPRGDWLFELKLDGYRALIIKADDQVRLLSRNEKELGGKFPEILAAAGQLKASHAIIDGEIVAIDDKGRSSFQLLQASALGETRPPILYYAFDLLELNGTDWKNRSLTERKAALEKLIKKRGPIRFSPSLGTDGPLLLAEVRKLGLEGLIGKRIDSKYEAGQRSGAWVKLKVNREQEVIIGGYTDPEGNRLHFGSLLIGVYENKRLCFSGKVGTGFDDKRLHMLKNKLDALSRRACPFANLPEKRQGRYGQGVTPSEMKRCHWVEPRLVCQVKFHEWTRDGKLRHPVFIGLREDKNPRDVVREFPGKADKSTAQTGVKHSRD